jgi:murein DD-endopeptidase MepM/ murein hydrolase activator NlpD
VDRPERPRFSHPHGGAIVAGFGLTQSTQKIHTSVDYAAAPRDTVRAAADGEVSQVRPEGSGQRLTVRHAYGYATAYAPLSEVVAQVGDCVSAGDVLGRVGPTPLHFEVMINGRLVDPERIRGGLPPR